MNHFILQFLPNEDSILHIFKHESNAESFLQENKEHTLSINENAVGLFLRKWDPEDNTFRLEFHR